MILENQRKLEEDKVNYEELARAQRLLRDELTDAVDDLRRMTSSMDNQIYSDDFNLNQFKDEKVKNCMMPPDLSLTMSSSSLSFSSCGYSKFQDRQILSICDNSTISALTRETDDMLSCAILSPTDSEKSEKKYSLFCLSDSDEEVINRDKSYALISYDEEDCNMMQNSQSESQERNDTQDDINESSMCDQEMHESQDWSQGEKETHNYVEDNKMCDQKQVDYEEPLYTDNSGIPIGGSEGSVLDTFSRLLLAGAWVCNKGSHEATIE